MILFVGGVCLAFACLVVFSSAVNKTEEEKKLDLLEQERYIREWNKRKGK